MDLIESYSLCAGVNTIKRITTRQERNIFLSEAVNRSCLNLINETRPPFTEIKLSFETKEEEYIFRNSAITGMKFCNGEEPLFSSFIIVAVGDRIMAGFANLGLMNFFTVYKGINPDINHSYFSQALNIVTFQNSIDEPLYWTCDVSSPMKKTVESKFFKSRAMPIGKMSCFAHGRFFVVTPQNLVFASDYIYSQGLGIAAREAVMSFSESAYPSSGDGFGAPSEIGSITGIVAVPQANTLNGHGDVMVLCNDGVFSIAPNRKIRNEWTNDPEMQKLVLTGKGCSAHDSISIFSGQIMYRDSFGGVSSLNLDINNYQNLIDFYSISDSANKYLSYDNNSPDIQYSSSANTSKRLLTSVGHQKERSKEMGTHTYCIGIVSACMQKDDGKSNLAWEGIWTGPRPIKLINGFIGGSKKCILASYDTDKQNRLYLFDETSRSDDFSNGARKPISTKFSFNNVFFNESGNEPLVLKSLNKVEALMIDSSPTKFDATFTVNSFDQDHAIDFQLTEITGCGLTTIRKLSNDICGTASNTQNGKSPRQGYYYDVTFYTTGRSSFAKTTIQGTVISGGFDSARCENVKSRSITQIPQLDCRQSDNDFFYSLP